MKKLAMLIPMVLLITAWVVGQDKTADEPLAVEETTVAAVAVADDSPLSELGWMVGTWVDEAEESRIVTECSWAEGGKFLKRTFSVMVDDEVTLHGDQFVGWDPVEERIRSWTFDSEGGIGEGRWYQDDNRWIVKTSFRLASGERASATNIITYVDENTVTWQSIGREVAGELQPSIPEVTVVRQDATKKTDGGTSGEESK